MHSRIPHRCHAVLTLGLLLAGQAARGDNSLSQRDNIGTSINQRQAAELKIPAGIASGSTLNAFVRNYYFARDNHHTLARRDQREWAQGFMLFYRSGYTDSPIGVGLDVHGFSTLKLDGGGGSGGSGVLPLDSRGKPQDEFSGAGAALKLRGFGNLVQIGDQLLENPLIASGVSRMVPQTYSGITLKNFALGQFWLDSGYITRTRLRNQSGRSRLTSGYGIGNKAGVPADRESSHIAWLGGNYAGSQGTRVALYGGQLDDIWNQYYLGIDQDFRVGDDLVLTPYLHYYKTRDQGDRQLGRIDNDAWSGGLNLKFGEQRLGLGLQKVDGDTPFDFLAQNDKVFLYLNNAAQYADFNGPGEKSWKLQYQTGLAWLRAPDLQFSASYIRGKADLTRVDPASVGYGYLYNPEGKDAHHWERDLSLRYAVPAGAAKGLSLTLRWATHRPGDGYTAPGNTRGNSSSDEYRIIIDYPIHLL